MVTAHYIPIRGRTIPRVELVDHDPVTANVTTVAIVTNNFEPSRIPPTSRRGDGLGCRKHAYCRHSTSWQQKPHWRTVDRERAIRAARLAHPRNAW